MLSPFVFLLLHFWIIRLVNQAKKISDHIHVG